MASRRRTKSLLPLWAAVKALKFRVPTKGQKLFSSGSHREAEQNAKQTSDQGHTRFYCFAAYSDNASHGIIATVKIWRYFLRLPNNDIFGQNTMKRLRNLFHWDISLQKEGSHLACGVNPGIGTAYRQKRNRMPGNFLHRGLQRRTDGYAIGLYLKAAVIGAVVGDGQFNLSPLFFPCSIRSTTLPPPPESSMPGKTP